MSYFAVCLALAFAASLYHSSFVDLERDVVQLKTFGFGFIAINKFQDISLVSNLKSTGMRFHFETDNVGIMLLRPGMRSCLS